MGGKYDNPGGIELVWEAVEAVACPQQRITTFAMHSFCSDAGLLSPVPLFSVALRRWWRSIALYTVHHTASSPQSGRFTVPPTNSERDASTREPTGR